MARGYLQQFGLAFLGAWLCTYVLACVFHTQRVLHELTEIEIAISVSDRIATTLQDIWGLLPAYGSAIALGLFISLIFTTILARRFSHIILLAGLAGGATMLLILLAMQPIMEVTLIAGAREPVGVVMQVGAGIIGGIVFGWVYSARNASTPAA